MLYYVTPILARMAGTIIYVQRRGKKEKKRLIAIRINKKPRQRIILGLLKKLYAVHVTVIIDRGF
jgi:hypothetical protein